jgi:DNA-binding Xre family transcriptional regulator
LGTGETSLSREIGIAGERLMLEMARRGLSSADLARQAEVSVHTIRRARAGKPIRAASFRSIAAALARTPALKGSEYLLDGS